jgi:hypothetical protein
MRSLKKETFFPAKTKKKQKKKPHMSKTKLFFHEGAKRHALCPLRFA